jgi:tight adherence protein B
MRRLLVAAAGVGLALSPVLMTGTAAADDTDLTISHVEPAGDHVNILLSVPQGVEADLDGISVTFNEKPATSEAQAAGEDSENKVRRTTVLAIDTSESMAGARFAAAKLAAETFLEHVPDDVYVGVVTFDSEVKTELAPTLDRDAALEVIGDLELALGTRLYDGVISAVKVAGTEGQRSILVLSDGANTNKTKLASVTKSIKDAEVSVDAVALDQTADDVAPLRSMATAGSGSVIAADPAALTEAFTAEADSLARQILVTAEVPETVTGREATVGVTVPGGPQPLTAQTYTLVRGEIDEGAGDVASAPQDDPGLQIPKPVMYGGLAGLGIGLLILLTSIMSMATAGSLPKTVEQRIAAFGTTGSGPGGAENADNSAFHLDQAKDAAASMLHRNRGLEARIERRLEAAGSALKPAEWLLMHGAIIILAGLVGLLLGEGSFLLLLLGLGLGVFVPWFWLGRRRKKRINAFNSGLADSLQLISGSLSAGMSLAQSLDAVVNEGNEPIAGEFKRVLVESRLGVPLEVALEGIAQRIESADFAWVVMAIRIQREVGGNLAELLNTVAATLRERDYLRRQVKSLSAEGRLSAYILVALPIGMLGYMLGFRREYVMPLFTEVLGILLLFVALVLLSLGWFMMSRIVKVEV